MMRWFGFAPFARICQDTPQVPVPVGVSCGWCAEAIAAHDNGLYYANPDSAPFHHECFIRMIVGSAAHQQGTCSCRGGEDHDPPELSIRDAAKLAYLAFRGRQEHVQ